MTPRALMALIPAVAVVGLLGSSTAQVPARTVQHTATHAVPVVHHVAAKRAGCHTPAPTTPAGYTRMFAHLNPAQWGAADVSISVAIPGGRSVWLYGDTLSTGRFVHSTAIVQHGGCLHVSHGGGQLIGNDTATRIYWINSARWTGKALAIVARLTVINPAGGPWAFHDTGTYRTFTAAVSAAGDVTVTGRGVLRHAPLHNNADFRAVGPHHFTYAAHTHSEARLVSGRTLVTVCQNWDDGKAHKFADYRPIFSSK